MAQVVAAYGMVAPIQWARNRSGGHGGGILLWGGHGDAGWRRGRGIRRRHDHWAAGTFTYGAGGGAGGAYSFSPASNSCPTPFWPRVVWDKAATFVPEAMAATAVFASIYTCGGYAQGTTEAEAALDDGSLQRRAFQYPGVIRINRSIVHWNQRKIRDS